MLSWSGNGGFGPAGLLNQGEVFHGGVQCDAIVLNIVPAKQMNISK